MAKLTKDFPVNLNIKVPNDLRLLIIAVAYHRGEGGKYAGPARDFMMRGARAYQAALSEKERARFEQILANITTSDAYRKKGQG